MKRIKTIIFILVLSSSLLAQTVRDLPELKDPYSPILAAGELFFIDDFTVYRYSLDPWELKNTFAGNGDEVDQFKYRPTIWSFQDEIVGCDYLKTNWFSKKGELTEVIPYSDFEDFDTGQEMILLPIKNRFVRIVCDHDARTRTVLLADSEYRTIKQLHQGSYNWNGGNPLPHRIHVECSRDKIFVSDSQKGFMIKVFDEDGYLIDTIDKTDFPALQLTKEDQKAIMEEIRLTQPQWVYDQLKDDAKFESHFPVINHFQVDNDKIYVTTERRHNNKKEMIILDLDGNILRRLYLAMPSKKRFRRILRYDPYTVHNDILYELVRAEGTENWQLLMTPLNY